MSPDDKTGANNLVTMGRKHLVCGAGGSRAILGSAGVIMACEIAGIEEWETIGGISGGSLPALFRACGYKGPQLIREAVSVDFAKLVPAHATPLHTFVAFLLKDRFEYTRPKRGVMGSEPLGDYAEMMAKAGPDMQLLDANGQSIKWPKKFWTMGVVARTQILFTADGVFQYLRNGQFRILSKEPAPIGIAIRATCAVPGIIDASPYKHYHVFDGALSWDGQCPVGISIRHFNALPENIISCDVGDEQHRFANTFRWFWSLLCGGHCVDHEGPKTPIPESVLMMKPNIWSVRSLQFDLTLDQKWQAVMSGFQEGVIELTRAGMLSGDKQKLAFAICMDIEKLKALAK